MIRHQYPLVASLLEPVTPSAESHTTIPMAENRNPQPLLADIVPPFALYYAKKNYWRRDSFLIGYRSITGGEFAVYRNGELKELKIMKKVVCCLDTLIKQLIY